MKPSSKLTSMIKNWNLYPRLVYDIWRRILPRYVTFSRPGTRVLECGTGTGNFLGLIAEWFPQASLFGLDIDRKALDQARHHSPHTSCLLASAESLPFSDNCFALVISHHMIEHLRAPEKFLKEAHRVLKPTGLLVFATPNPIGAAARFMKDRWSGYCEEHIALHSPESWQRMLLDQEFTILRQGTTGLSGIPLFQRFPLNLVNWGMLFLFGFSPWDSGEAYVCLACRENYAIPPKAFSSAGGAE